MLTLLGFSMTLAGCASKPTAAVPVELLLPNCWLTLPADLKAPPIPAPDIRPGERMVETVAADRLRERQKDRRTADIQAHVKACSGR